MSNRYLSTSPLPFENNAALTLFAEERTPVDVVEPTPAPHSRLHPDVRVRAARPRGFVAPTLFDVTGDHPRPDDTPDESDESNDNNAVDEGPDGRDDRDYIVSRQQLLRRDHDERQACRADIERERAERRALRNARSGLRIRRRAASRARYLDAVGQRLHRPDPHLWGRREPGHQPGGGGRRSELSVGDRVRFAGNVADVATHTGHVKRVVAPLQGSALAIYFVLLPYVVVTKWHRTQRQNDGTLVRALLVALALFWLVFLFHLVRDVWRLRRGVVAGSGGSAWLAGALVALLSLFLPTSAGALATSVSASHAGASSVRSSSAPDPVKRPTRPTAPRPSGAGILPLALMAKRRSDLIRQQQFVDENYDVDESIDLLRARNPGLLTHLRQLIGERRDGVLDVPNALDPTSASSDIDDAYVACALGPTPFGTLVSFAREGGVLAILPTWNSADVIEASVALHHGRLEFADNELELLRALATRSVRNTLVVFLGNRDELEDDVAACSITLSPYSERTRSSATSSWTAVAPALRDGEVHVELLRAEPRVLGLREPLTPTLRRRGVEMLAYLALHRHEPVTGERLRTRVLTHADVDASLRTLANTASVVRRSAGVDRDGPRLHAVTSSGLYVTHGITSDVETLHESRVAELVNSTPRTPRHSCTRPSPW